MAKSKQQFEEHPVMGLLTRLKSYVVDWSHVSQRNAARDEPDYEPGIDRSEQNLDIANVVSSELVSSRSFESMRRHAVALDIDVPAWLVPSSTPGHSHLYIDVAIPHHRYMALLSALADAGVIQRGYAEVSIARGHSDLRLPWVEKGDPTPKIPEPTPQPEVKGLTLDDVDKWF